MGILFFFFSFSPIVAFGSGVTRKLLNSCHDSVDTRRLWRAASVPRRQEVGWGVGGYIISSGPSPLINAFVCPRTHLWRWSRPDIVLHCLVPGTAGWPLSGHTPWPRVPRARELRWLVLRWNGFPHTLRHALRMCSFPSLFGAVMQLSVAETKGRSDRR